MNEEQKRALMVGFVLPFSGMLMLYYFSAGLLCQQVYNLPEPNFSTMMKYAIATYNSWFSLKLDDFMFAIPAEFSADIYAHTGLQEVTITTYRQAVDMFVNPPIYRLFPAYLLLSFVASMSILIAKSREKGNDKQLSKKQALQQHIRGTQLVDEKKLVDDSQRLVTDPITFLPTASGNLLISDYRCKGHIFLLGSTGTGKSETLSNLIGGILDKHPGIKVIYADRKGEFFSKFGEPDKDILFNPFDARTVGWSLFNEIRFNKHDPYRAIPPDLVMMAKILFPTAGKRETIWDNAAARIFMSAVCYCLLNKKATMQDLYEFNQMPADTMAAALKTLPVGLSTGYGVIQDPSSKAAMSALLTYTTAMEDLSCLNQKDGSWSVTEWVNDRKSSSNLYLSSAGRNDKAFVRLITLLLDFAGREVQQFEDNGGQKMRLLFVFDELAALPKLSTLSYLLSQARSKGVGCILATQSFEQIKAIYGTEQAHEIFANTKTKFIYSMPDPTDSAYLAKAIGTAENFRKEKSENQSSAGLLGKGEDRRGVNESQKVVEDKLFLPSQIANQRTGQTIVQFPDFDGEVAQIQLLKADRYPVRQPAFVELEQDLVAGKALPFIMAEEAIELPAEQAVDEQPEEPDEPAPADNEDSVQDIDDDVIY